MRARFILAMLVLTIVAAGAPQSAHAGSTGIVISRLELRGPGLSSDSFMAYRSSDAPDGMIEPGLFVCGPSSVVAFEGLPECTAGTYEVETPPLPVGSTVRYEFRRHPGAGAEMSAFCLGSITVQEQPQTVICVYENQGAAVLPDVATGERSTVPTQVLGALFLACSAFGCLALMRGRRPVTQRR